MVEPTTSNHSQSGGRATCPNFAQRHGQRLPSCPLRAKNCRHLPAGNISFLRRHASNFSSSEGPSPKSLAYMAKVRLCSVAAGCTPADEVHSAGGNQDMEVSTAAGADALGQQLTCTGWFCAGLGDRPNALYGEISPAVTALAIASCRFATPSFDSKLPI